MKILNSLTVKNLKLNKKRTIVTIIGISLSIALICAITTFVASFQSARMEREIKKGGNYHIRISNVSDENMKYLENNVKVEKVSKEEEIGYSKLEASENPNKPYGYVMAYDDNRLQNGGIILKEGRMPENENEILIPEHLITNGKVELKVGDTLNLNIGNRYKDIYKLTQSNPYYTDEDLEERKKDKSYEEYDLKQETFTPEEEKQYKIVGIMERLNIEDYSAPGYTMITKLKNTNGNKERNIALLLKNPSETYEFSKYLKDTLNIDENKIQINESLLYYMGIFKSNRMENFLLVMAIIVIGIIIFTSAFVIKNSFNISLTEKTKELGMIASVGATSKQLRRSIFFEGAILGIISIPLGIIIGVFAIWIVLIIVNSLLNSMSQPLVDNFDLKLIVSLPAVGIAVLVSIVMIIISLIKPSYRAGKITPIDAIRENTDIKQNKKKNKDYKITKKLFGIEGVIARKNFNRSKRKYRTTIFSIFLSIVLFISMSSFVENMFGLSSIEVQTSDVNLIIYGYADKSEEQKQEYFDKIKNIEGIKNYAILKTKQYVIDENKYYTERAKERYSQSTGVQTVLMSALGDKEYKNYIKKLGLKYEEVKDKAILYDTDMFFEYEDGKDGVKRVEDNILKINEKEKIDLYERTDESGNLIDLSNIEIAVRTKELPMGGIFRNEGYPVLIVSDEYINKLKDVGIMSMKISAEDPYKVQEKIIEIDKTNKDNIYNLEEEIKANNTLNLIISIFLYGFIAVISIIGITNIFNTITTNMALRNKEFAILKSIGMTNKEFRKMINFESFIYGLKALILGLPVGILLSYLIHEVTSDIYQEAYKLPIVPIIISIIFVFVVIFITMQYSVNKTKKQNIIETIRKENI